MEPMNFALVFSLQLLLIIYDFVINSIVDYTEIWNVVKLVLFIVQDICIVFQIIVLFLELFNTTTFQAGFVRKILGQFKLTIFVLVIYLLLSIGLHAWTLTLSWNEPKLFIWKIGGYYVLYIIHRVWATLYYYYYKRSALKLVDPMFYHSLETFRKQIIRDVGKD